MYAFIDRRGWIGGTRCRAAERVWAASAGMIPDCEGGPRSLAVSRTRSTRAVITERLMALFFVTHPHYFNTMLNLKGIRLRT